MPEIVGNVLGILFSLIAGGFAYASFEKGVMIFLAIAYGLWIIILISDIGKRPRKEDPFCRQLGPDLFRAYRRYHVAIDFPMAGQVYAALLNMLRVLGLLWGGLCIWKELYLASAGAFAYFFLAGNLIVRNNPWFYMGREAQQGRPSALAELSKISGIIKAKDPSRHQTPDVGDKNEP